MTNSGMFSSLFIEEMKGEVSIHDEARSRLRTHTQAWKRHEGTTGEALWNSFLKQAFSYLEFVPTNTRETTLLYPLYDDYGFKDVVSVVGVVPEGEDLDSVEVGRFYPAKLIGSLEKKELDWGILTNGRLWRLYSRTSSRPFEDYVELDLEGTLAEQDEAEYALFEHFFHKDSFIPAEEEELRRCRLDRDRERSEGFLEEKVKKPFLAQVDEVLQYICNGFIFDTRKSGEEYSEEEREEIFESAVKLIYRSLFLFYAESRRLLPSDRDKAEAYQRNSIGALCGEARKFKWGERRDNEEYDLWKHLKGLTAAVNDGDPEYGIMGYNGGLFDDEQERFLGNHQLRNDFLSRALYLLAYVEPYDNDQGREYPIPYEDLEVRHLGELYENILEYTVLLADADRLRRRTKKGVEILLASQTSRQIGDTFIKKGDVYFGESALERKQTGSYYTPESIVRFLNTKSVANPLRETFNEKYRQRFEEFISQAGEEYDEQTKRGAVQSAVALVDRFVEDDLLTFTVCDPAMGSGHFLVDTANQMTSVVISLLAEIPYVEGMASQSNSDPNYWRRRITRHSIYGVDLNPLAVNLAKLSLWLNSFAGEHKLTFLDHHLRCGNSLIGMRSLQGLREIPKRKKDKKKQQDAEGVLFNESDLSQPWSRAAEDFAEIATVDEDDTDQQRELLSEAEDEVVRVRSLADLYTAYLMDQKLSADEYRELFELRAEGKEVQETFYQSLPRVDRLVDEYAEKHRFFHWPLEFPDVFGPKAAGGFSATVGNPPWDIVKPNSQEFFSAYDKNFRSYNKQEAKRASQALMAANPNIAAGWESYTRLIQHQSEYFRDPNSYQALGKGDINTYKLFLEQFFRILQSDGRMGIVVPSGIYTDQGCQPLRELFFDESGIEFLYGFENRRAIFNIHRSFKFVLFGTQKGKKTDEFKCAFMEHEPRRLLTIDENALEMSVEQVRKFSPDTLSVMEFKSQKDIDVTTKIYGDWPLLGEKLEDIWNVKFRSELHMTNDSHLFINPDSLHNFDDYVWLWEGKQIWILSNSFAKPTKLTRKNDANKIDSVSYPRIAYRALAASTNERTLIVTLIPKGSPSGHSINVSPTDSLSGLLVSSLLSSFLIDWIIRNKVTTNLTMFYLYQLPILRVNYHNNELSAKIIAKTSRLVCTDSNYRNIWKDAFTANWLEPSFWYETEQEIINYGPAHEIEIRKRLHDEAPMLTPEWGPHCGVYDKLPDRRDDGDRAQLRAEIDAYVAHLYGMSRDDFSYILDTFPVLRNKEMKVFGEFKSKRKCLEEYDRIELIL